MASPPALLRRYPETNGHRVVQVVPLREVVLGEFPESVCGSSWGSPASSSSSPAQMWEASLVARNLGRRVEMAIQSLSGRRSAAALHDNS